MSAIKKLSWIQDRERLTRMRLSDNRTVDGFAHEYLQDGSGKYGVGVGHGGLLDWLQQRWWRIEKSREFSVADVNVSNG
ncbi:hypothetical protein ACCD10_20900 [Pseudomonas sp. Pseusp122]|uniref:hypothetical protein n=1 Tax=Pseudomonas sp. Pseusp122 TaxID=3243009 RepID=UPI0039B0EBB4